MADEYTDWYTPAEPWEIAEGEESAYTTAYTEEGTDDGGDWWDTTKGLAQKALGAAAANPTLSPFLTALHYADKPRAVAQSSLVELSALLGISDDIGMRDFKGRDTASWRDWWDQISDSADFGTYYGDATSNRWANLALGFTFDVATDPLTYAAGIGLGVKGGKAIAKALAIDVLAGTNTPKAALRYAASKADEFADEAQSLLKRVNDAPDDPGIAREADEFLKQTGDSAYISQQIIKLATPRIGPGGIADDIAVDTLLGPKRSGIRLRPFVKQRGGMQLVSQETASSIFKPFRTARGAIQESRPYRGIADRFGNDYQNALYRKFLATPDTLPGIKLGLLKTMGEAAMTQRQVGAWLSGRRIQVNSLKGALQSKTSRALAAVKLLETPEVDGRWVASDEVGRKEVSAAIKELGGEPKARAAVREMRAIFEDTHRWVASNGVDLGYRENYFPWWMDRDALAELGQEYGKRKRPTVSTKERRYHQEFLGHKVPVIEDAIKNGTAKVTDEGRVIWQNPDHATYKRQLAEIGKEQYGNNWIDIIDRDPFRVMNGYLNQMANKVLTKRLAQSAADNGVGVMLKDISAIAKAQNRFNQSTKSQRKFAGIRDAVMRQSDLETEWADPANAVDMMMDLIPKEGRDYLNAIRSDNVLTPQQKAGLENIFIAEYAAALSPKMYRPAYGGSLKGWMLKDDGSTIIAPDPLFDPQTASRPAMSFTKDGEPILEGTAEQVETIAQSVANMSGRPGLASEMLLSEDPGTRLQGLGLPAMSETPEMAVAQFYNPSDISPELMRKIQALYEETRAGGGIMPRTQFVGDVGAEARDYENYVRQRSLELAVRSEEILEELRQLPVSPMPGVTSPSALDVFDNMRLSAAMEDVRAFLVSEDLNEKGLMTLLNKVEETALSSGSHIYIRQPFKPGPNAVSEVLGETLWSKYGISATNEAGQRINTNAFLVPRGDARTFLAAWLGRIRQVRTGKHGSLSLGMEAVIEQAFWDQAPEAFPVLPRLIQDQANIAGYSGVRESIMEAEGKMIERLSAEGAAGSAAADRAQAVFEVKMDLVDQAEATAATRNITFGAQRVQGPPQGPGGVRRPAQGSGFLLEEDLVRRGVPLPYMGAHPLVAAEQYARNFNPSSARGRLLTKLDTQMWQLRQMTTAYQNRRGDDTWVQVGDELVTVADLEKRIDKLVSEARTTEQRVKKTIAKEAKKPGSTPPYARLRGVDEDVAGDFMEAFSPDRVREFDELRMRSETDTVPSADVTERLSAEVEQLRLNYRGNPNVLIDTISAPAASQSPTAAARQLELAGVPRERIIVIPARTNAQGLRSGGKVAYHLNAHEAREVLVNLNRQLVEGAETAVPSGESLRQFGASILGSPFSEENYWSNAKRMLHSSILQKWPVERPLPFRTALDPETGAVPNLKRAETALSDAQERLRQAENIKKHVDEIEPPGDFRRINAEREVNLARSLVKSYKRTVKLIRAGQRPPEPSLSNVTPQRAAMTEMAMSRRGDDELSHALMDEPTGTAPPPQWAAGEVAEGLNDVRVRLAKQMRRYNGKEEMVAEYRQRVADLRTERDIASKQIDALPLPIMASHPAVRALQYARRFNPSGEMGQKLKRADYLERRLVTLDRGRDIENPGVMLSNAEAQRISGDIIRELADLNEELRPLMEQVPRPTYVEGRARGPFAETFNSVRDMQTQKEFDALRALARANNVNALVDGIAAINSRGRALAHRAGPQMSGSYPDLKRSLIHLIPEEQWIDEAQTVLIHKHQARDVLFAAEKWKFENASFAPSSVLLGQGENLIRAGAKVAPPEIRAIDWLESDLVRHFPHEQPLLDMGFTGEAEDMVRELVQKRNERRARTLPPRESRLYDKADRIFRKQEEYKRTVTVADNTLQTLEPALSQMEIEFGGVGAMHEGFTRQPWAKSFDDRIGFQKPKNGFAVAVEGSELVAPEGATDGQFLRTLRKWEADHSQQLNSGEYWVGSWGYFDPDNPPISGKPLHYEVNLTRVYQNRAEAEMAARQFGQNSIYDLKADDLITIDAQAAGQPWKPSGRGGAMDPALWQGRLRRLEAANQGRVAGRAARKNMDRTPNTPSIDRVLAVLGEQTQHQAKEVVQSKRQLARLLEHEMFKLRTSGRKVDTQQAEALEQMIRELAGTGEGDYAVTAALADNAARAIDTAQRFAVVNPKKTTQGWRTALEVDEALVRDHTLMLDDAIDLSERITASLDPASDFSSNVKRIRGLSPNSKEGASRIRSAALGLGDSAGDIMEAMGSLWDAMPGLRGDRPKLTPKADLLAQSNSLAEAVKTLSGDIQETFAKYLTRSQDEPIPANAIEDLIEVRRALFDAENKWQLQFARLGWASAPDGAMQQRLAKVRVNRLEAVEPDSRVRKEWERLDEGGGLFSTWYTSETDKMIRQERRAPIAQQRLRQVAETAKDDKTRRVAESAAEAWDGYVEISSRADNILASVPENERSRVANVLKVLANAEADRADVIEWTGRVDKLDMKLADTEKEIAAAKRIVEQGLKAKHQRDHLKNEVGFKMREFIDGFETDKDFADAMKAITMFETPHQVLRGFDAFTSTWRGLAVSTPGFHVRNGIGGYWNNSIRGVSPKAHADFALAYKSLIKKMKDSPTPTTLTENEALVMEAMRQGVIGPGVYRHDVREAATKSWINPWAGAFGGDKQWAWVHFNRNVGGTVEDVLRGSLALKVYKDAIKNGVGEDGAWLMAAGEVDKFHFNYADLSKVDRGMRRAVPFWTWMSRNIGLQMELLAHKPQWALTAERLYNNIGEGAPENPFVPAYFDRSRYVQLTQRAWLTPELPHTALARESGIEWPPAILTNLNPALRLGPELVYGYDFYRGYELAGTERWSRAFENVMPLWSRFERAAIEPIRDEDKRNISYMGTAWASVLGIPVRWVRDKDMRNVVRYGLERGVGGSEKDAKVDARVENILKNINLGQPPPPRFQTDRSIYR